MKIWALVVGIIVALMGLISLIPGLYFNLLGLNISHYMVSGIFVVVGALLIYYSVK